MTVAPQVNYITMMLPIKMPSTIFKQFDDIKHFLLEWEKAKD